MLDLAISSHPVLLFNPVLAQRLRVWFVDEEESMLSVQQHAVENEVICAANTVRRLVFRGLHLDMLRVPLLEADYKLLYLLF